MRFSIEIGTPTEDGGWWVDVELAGSDPQTGDGWLSRVVSGAGSTPTDAVHDALCRVGRLVSFGDGLTCPLCGKKNKAGSFLGVKDDHDRPDPAMTVVRYAIECGNLRHSSVIEVSYEIAAWRKPMGHVSTDACPTEKTESEKL